MIILEIDGVSYTGFTSANLNRDIEALAGDFNFTATAEATKNFPIKRMSSVVIKINDIVKLTGYVEKISVSYDNGSHTINISGRDKTSVLIDSSVYGTRKFNAPTTLIKIIEKIISDLGADLKVINKTNETLKIKTPCEAEVAANAFEFLDEQAKKLGCLLTTDGEGNVIIIRANTDKITSTKLQNIKGAENNILSCSFDLDDSQRFKKYKVIGQQIPTLDMANFNVTSSKGEATDNDCILNKKLIIHPETDVDILDAKKRAQWEANVRRARSLKYNCTVQGWEYEAGKLWDFNKSIMVQDDFCDIEQDMLIKSVSYTLDESSGSKTEISLLVPDAYTLEAELAKLQRKKGKLGNVFLPTT